MPEDKQSRAWLEVAQELMHERNPQKMVQLSRELTVALQKTMDKVASAPLQSKLVH